MPWNAHANAGIADLYDSERKALKGIAFALRMKHSFRGVKTIEEEAVIQRAFENEARNRCAEIGLIIEVLWSWEDEKTGQQSPDVSSDPTDHNLYWNPKLIVTGRTDKLPEFDHEKQQFEVTRGVLGDPGFIREDGTKREDPKKRDIY
jgi:hypothetical protein